MSFDLTARLSLVDVNFSRNMSIASRSINGVKSATSSVMKSLGLMTSVAAGAGLAVSSINKAGEFEAQMSKAGAIAGATGKDMGRLKDTAMSLGASTSKSATEIAQAMTELGAKGFDTNKIIGAMPGIINAAQASGEDLAMTSDVVTSALNAFGLKASSAGHIADVLSMSANKSAAGIEDLGYSFKYAAPVAKGLGISLEELSAATGMMVDKGLAGEQAGTALRMGLMRLASAPKQAQKAMDKLGFSAIDSHNKFKNLNTITTELRQKMNGLTQAQKVQALGQIFGTEAATGWLDLVDSTPGKLHKMTTSLVNSNGTATKTSKRMMDNMKGSIELLKGSFETLQLKLASGLLPVISSGAKSLSKMMDNIKPGQIQQWGENIKTAGEKVLAFAGFVKNNWGAITTTVLSLAVGITTLKLGLKGLMIISTITKLFRAWRAGVTAAAAAEMGLNAAMLLSPWTWVIAGIAALVAIAVVLIRNWDKVKSAWGTVWSSIERAAASAVNSVIGKINGLIGILNKIPGVSIPLVAKVNWGSYNSAVKKLSGLKNVVGSSSKSGTYATTAGGRQLSSFAGGISRLPNDGPIFAHKGERVLTRWEARQYEQGQNPSIHVGSITINGSGSTEKDAEAILGHIVRRWQQLSN